MSNVTSGVVFMLLSAFSFAAMNGIARLLANHGMPSMENVFFRSFIMVLIILLIYFYNFLHDKIRDSRNIIESNSKDSIKKKKTYKKGGWFSLSVRVIMGGLSMLALFYNISTIPLGTATTFTQSAPLYVVLLGAIFLKERLNFAVISATILGFIGILLISNPTFSGISPINVAVGIFGGFSMAVAFITLKGLKEYFSAMFIILSFGVGNAILSALGMLIPVEGVGGWITPNLSDWALVLAMGIAGTLGQHFLTKAYLSAPAGIVAPIDYTRIIFSIFFGILLGDSLPNLLTTSGIVLIILSGILIVLPSLLDDISRLKKRKKV